jgi:hypothetical protein
MAIKRSPELGKYNEERNRTMGRPPGPQAPPRVETKTVTCTECKKTFCTVDKERTQCPFCKRTLMLFPVPSGSQAVQEQKKFFIVSLKYSKGGEITLWRPNACGYTTVLEYAGVYTAEQIADNPSYYDNGWGNIAVPCHEIESLCVRVIGNSDRSDFIQRARQRGLKDGTPINGFAQYQDGTRCEAVHANGERCTRVDGHGKTEKSTLGLFHITPSDFIWYTEGLD